MSAILQGQRGDLLLAPAVPGDIMLVHMNGHTNWRIQKASYMASDASVSIGTKVQGLAQGCCSGEGFFILSASGTGRLLLNSFGGIIRYHLQPGEVRIALPSAWSLLLLLHCGAAEVAPWLILRNCPLDGRRLRHPPRAYHRMHPPLRLKASAQTCTEASRFGRTENLTPI
jgi:Mitochondrial biogenesis AIM24